MQGLEPWPRRYARRNAGIAGWASGMHIYTVLRALSSCRTHVFPRKKRPVILVHIAGGPLACIFTQFLHAFHAAAWPVAGSPDCDLPKLVACDPRTVDLRTEDRSPNKHACRCLWQYLQKRLGGICEALKCSFCRFVFHERAQFRHFLPATHKARCVPRTEAADTNARKAPIRTSHSG